MRSFALIARKYGYLLIVRNLTNSRWVRISYQRQSPSIPMDINVEIAVKLVTFKISKHLNAQKIN